MSDEDPTLAAARDDLKQRTGDYGPFELDVHHITATSDTDDRDAFLLVGVNTDNAECVRIFESWVKTHSGVEVVGSDPMDEAPAVEVKEIRCVE